MGKQLLAQLKTIWNDMSPARRGTTAALLGVVLIGFVWIIASQASTTWVDLGRTLSPDDLPAFVEALEAKQIPVRMKDGGVVQVPEDRLDEARLIVSTTMATSGVSGMEMFDNVSFGQSAFQEQVNYHRALEGEMSRSITGFDAVSGARVHLSIPKRRLFKRDQKAPTASVQLTLRPGVELEKSQIAAIRHLVASSIEGLKANAVTVVDQRGAMLARPADDAMTGESAFDLQYQYERKLEERVVALLEPLVGVGKVRTQVTALMDFTQVDLTEKQLDPDKQVVTGENRKEESSTTMDPAAGGVAGAAANIPGGPGARQTEQGTQRTARTESITYETESRLRRTQTREGRLDRLSVAVIVDGEKVEGEEGDVWAALDAERLAQLEDIVAKAVGLNTARGDSLSVQSIQFQDVAAIEAMAEPEAVAPWMRELVKWGALLLLLLVLVFGVVRPLVRMARPEAGVGGLPTLALADGGTYDAVQGIAEGVSAGALPAHGDDDDGLVPIGERLRLRAVESTQGDPERAAQIIRAWLLMEEE